MKFKVGDKVEVIKGFGVGYKGYVVNINMRSRLDYFYNIEFDDKTQYKKRERNLILVASSQNVTNKIKGSSIYLDKITLPATIREEDIVDNFDSNCSHKWKLYNGFTESYEYCELCDKKRNLWAVIVKIIDTLSLLKS